MTLTVDLHSHVFLYLAQDQRVLSVLEKLTHASIAIIDIHTGFIKGNVHKSMRCIEVHNFSVIVHGELSKLLMSGPMSGAMPTIQYITVNTAYNITEH